MAMQLTLKSDLESVDFINDSNAKYYLLDETFQAPPPTPVEIRASGGTGRILSRSYDNRTVNFAYMVKGNTYEDVMASISKVFRIMEFASQEQYLDGGSYTGTLNFGAGTTTGDNGVILRVKVYTPASPATLDKEDGTTYADTRTYTMKVISGSQEVTKLFNSASMGNSKFAYDVRVTLICEPYALGDSRVIAEVDTPYLGTISSTNAAYVNNKLIIDGSLIPGDAPALTRIYTAVTDAHGIIMGRDAGNSLVNCPSFPVMIAGTGTNDMMVTGICESTTQYHCQVRISAAGATDYFEYSTNNGGSWSSAQAIVPHKKFAIGTTGASVYFFTKTGHTESDVWKFRTNQSYVLPDTTPDDDDPTAVTIYNPAAPGTYTNLFTRSGMEVTSFYLNIPQKARGKYKIVAYVSGNAGLNPADAIELRLYATYLGYNAAESGDVVKTQNSLFDWSRRNGLIDFGTIDFTPFGTPATGHPGSSLRAKFSILVRSNYRFTSTATITINGIGIFPCSDNNSFLWTGWKVDGFGREVFCNYDYQNPYIAEVSAAYPDKENMADANFTNYTTIELDDVSTIALDETHVGNVLTLIPGVKNTIVFAPLTKLGSTSFYKDFYFFNSSRTGSVVVAIRPRYLLVG